METKKTVAQHIETISDIEALLVWIKDHAQNPNIRFYSAVLHNLYAEGEFAAVHIDTLIRLVAKKNLWSGDLNQEKHTELSLLRDRFARRMRWLNKMLEQKKSPYADTLALIYDRSSSRYQMVTEPESVVTFRNHRCERRWPEVAIEFHEEELSQGLPILYVDKELEFSIRSSIRGFVHIFHQDGDGHVDCLFPEYGSELSFEISKGKEIFFPDAVGDLCKLKRWCIGAPERKIPVRQKVFVWVTARNVDISVEDAVEALSSVQDRRINVEHVLLDDLKNRDKLSAVAEYCLKTKPNAPS